MFSEVLTLFQKKKASYKKQEALELFSSSNKCLLCARNYGIQYWKRQDKFLKLIRSTLWCSRKSSQDPTKIFLGGQGRDVSSCPTSKRSEYGHKKQTNQKDTRGSLQMSSRRR